LWESHVGGGGGGKKEKDKRGGNWSMPNGGCSNKSKVQPCLWNWVSQKKKSWGYQLQKKGQVSLARVTERKRRADHYVGELGDGAIYLTEKIALLQYEFLRSRRGKRSNQSQNTRGGPRQRGVNTCRKKPEKEKHHHPNDGVRSVVVQASEIKRRANPGFALRRIVGKTIDNVGSPHKEINGGGV